MDIEVSGNKPWENSCEWRASNEFQVITQWSVLVEYIQVKPHSTFRIATYHLNFTSFISTGLELRYLVLYA